jgi:hypothetical protein
LGCFVYFFGGYINMDKSKYGLRADGTPKGSGFFGEIPMDNPGDFMTEFSIGVNFGDGEVQIPTLVPTLTGEEIMHLQSGGKVTKEIADKAKDFARGRLRSGRSPFYEEGKDKRADKLSMGISPEDLNPYDKYMKERFPTYGTPEFEDKFGGDDTKGLEDAYSPFDALTGGLAGSMMGGKFLLESALDPLYTYGIEKMRDNNSGYLPALFLGKKGAARAGLDVARDTFGQFSFLGDGKIRWEIPDMGRFDEPLKKGSVDSVGRFVGEDVADLYPEMYGSQIKSYDLPEDTGGQFGYNPTTDEREIRINKNLDYDPRTVAHETQHYIDSVEGYPRGGSPSHFKVEAEEQVKRDMPGLMNNLHEAQGNHSAMVDKFGKNSPEAIEAQDNVGKIAGLLYIQRNRAKYDIYRSLIGEVFARDTAERYMMPMRERYRTTPTTTEKNPVSMGNMVERYYNK